MRKKIYFLFLLCFPFIVWADTISINCPAEVIKDNDFSCDIIGNSQNDIMSLKTNVSVTEGLSFVGFIPNSVWQGNMIDNRISLYTADDVTGEFRLGTIKYKAIATGSHIITLDEAYFYDLENTIPVEAINKKINIVEKSTSTEKPSDNTLTQPIETSTYLMDITVENYYFDFYKDTYDYELTIKDEDKLVIQPVLEDNSSIVTINGNDKLKDGSLITITVVDQYGKNEKTYNIKIHKETAKQDVKNNSLIFIIIIGVLVVINILRILMKNKNKAGGK